MSIITFPYWKFQGRRLYLMPSAQMLPEFRPYGVHGNLVQRVLDLLEPWEGTKPPAVSVQLMDVSLVKEVVRVPRDTEPIWAIHRKHTAQRLDLSPFWRLPGGDLPRTDVLTIEVRGPVRRPQIVSVHAGEQRPSLPWQGSAKRYPVGECELFWSRHAYLMFRGGLIRQGSVSTQTPDWYVR